MNTRSEGSPMSIFAQLSRLLTIAGRGAATPFFGQVFEGEDRRR